MQPPGRGPLSMGRQGAAPGQLPLQDAPVPPPAAPRPRPQPAGQPPYHAHQAPHCLAQGRVLDAQGSLLTAQRVARRPHARHLPPSHLPPPPPPLLQQRLLPQLQRRRGRVARGPQARARVAALQPRRSHQRVWAAGF